MKLSKDAQIKVECFSPQDEYTRGKGTCGCRSKVFNFGKALCIEPEKDQHAFVASACKTPMTKCTCEHEDEQ